MNNTYDYFKGTLNVARTAAVRATSARAQLTNTRRARAGKNQSFSAKLLPSCPEKIRQAAPMPLYG